MAEAGSTSSDRRDPGDNDDGDPYDTRELRQWRSQQRRLRPAFVELLEWTATPVDVGLKVVDPATEYYARRAAAKLIERHALYVDYLEARYSSDLLNTAIRKVPDGDNTTASAKTRLTSGSITQHPLAPPAPEEGPSDDQRWCELREALLLIDIAEAHTSP